MDGIGNRTTLGFAKEATPFTAETATDYVVYVKDGSFNGNERADKVPLNAMTGSRYSEVGVVEGLEGAAPSFTVYMDEDTFAAWLLAFCTVSSALASGESAVYDHTFSFSSSNQPTTYTLFLDDPDRGDLIYAGFRPGSIEATFRKGQPVEVTISGTSKYPASGTATNSVTALDVYTAQHSTFEMADYGSALASVSVLEYTLRIDNGLSDDEDDYDLGSNSRQRSFAKGITIENELQLHFTNHDLKDDWKANQLKLMTATVKDTSRYVTGSVNNTNPQTVFEFVKGYLDGWTREGAGEDVLKQRLTFKPTDEPGVSDAPIKITVTNAQASY